MKTEGIVFSTLSEVVEIHSNEIERFGGDPGIRDMVVGQIGILEGLESASRLLEVTPGRP
jgi:hypothetical protein